jgi:HNH endonuclease
VRDCRLPIRGQIATFPVDHPTPRSSGGLTVLANLALACPQCNGHKWAHTSAPDPASTEVVPLFNPRVDRWEDHFHWSAADRTILEGKTASERATLLLLQMNHPNMVDIRRLLVALNLFTE